MMVGRHRSGANKPHAHFLTGEVVAILPLLSGCLPSVNCPNILHGTSQGKSL